MGKSQTYNYEVQVQNPIKEDSLYLFGAMSYKKAVSTLLEEAQRFGSLVGYIWPQTKLAERKLNNIPWVTNHSGIDFLKIDITINTPERKVYKISGKSVHEV